MLVVDDSSPDGTGAKAAELSAQQLNDLYGYIVTRLTQGNLRNDIKPEPRSVIISDCSYPHEVQRVTAGERVSLVFFVSRHADRNRRVY